MEDEEQGGFKVVDKRRFGADGSEKDEKSFKEERVVQPTRQAASDEPPLEDEELPEADFSFLLISLATQAGIALGEAPHPETGQMSMNLPAARLSVDLLGILQEKTKGNLTDDEAQLLENLLTHLRLRFVEVIRGK